MLLKVVCFALIALSASQIESVGCLNNGLARTPPMGWISWERFTCTVDCEQYPNDCLNEQLFRQMADRLVEDGYARLGYKYINLDDCWSAKQRQPGSENLLADPGRFPSGIQQLADYVHSRDLLFGIYGDCGTATCNGYPAQLKTADQLEENYFDLDAQQFANWQVDSLKFDGCNLAPEKQELICPQMAKSLAKTKRPMVLVCEFPFYLMRNHLQPNWTLAAEACNTWRFYEDVEDSWTSILNIIDISVPLQRTIMKFHGPGQWFDPDQLIVGNWALSKDQARVQMAIWSLWSAPLYMGNDLRSIAPEMGAILKNEPLIRVDQDPLGVFGQMVSEQNGHERQAFVKPVLPAAHGCPSFVVVYLLRATLGNSRELSFKLRDLLARSPIHLAAQRQREALAYANTTGPLIEPYACAQLIREAETRPRSAAPPPGLLVVPAAGGSQAESNLAPRREVPIQERRVTFHVSDLFGDQGAPAELHLDSQLVLRVNPSGVRAVKLTISSVV